MTLGVSAGGVSAQQDNPDVPNSAAFDDLLAALAPFQCPQLPSFTVQELRPLAGGFPGLNVDGVEERPDRVIIRCQYRPTAEPNAGTQTITFEPRLADGSSTVGSCTGDVIRNTDTGLSMNNAYPREAYDIVLGYSIQQRALDVVPNFEAEVLASIDVQLDALIPFSRRCPSTPVEITCPPIAGLEQTSTEQASPLNLLEASCAYDQAEVRVAWATDRSSADAVRATCFEAVESPRPRVGQVAADGQAAAAAWFSRLDDPATIDAVDTAADELLAQVLEQATPCGEIPVEAFAVDVPPYLADEFAPQRVAGSAIVTDAPLQPTITPSTTVPPTTVPPTTSTPPTTAAATTVAATAPPSSASVADAVADGTAVAAATNARSDESGWTTVLRIGSIVMLVLSLLGVAVALLLMRRESRVRPKLDVARMVIVLVVAAVSSVLLSRDAPVWAVLAAVAVGGILGFLQGSRMTLRAAGTRIYAKRTAWALVAFAAGLAVTQIAGLANRTGAITVGVALSFLSAAMTGGVIAGRRPHLVELRQASAAVLMVVAVAGIVLAASVPEGSGLAQEEEPTPTAPPSAPTTVAADVSGDPVVGDVPCRSVEAVERCAATEHLMSLVDWTRVELRAGLFEAFKPPIVMSVPFGLDEIPEPVSQTAEWQRRFDNRDPQPYTVDETITFSPTEEGVCCLMDYAGTGTFGETEYIAEGVLHDLVPVGLPLAGVEVSGIGGNVGGLPFTNEVDYGFGEQTVCVRYIAGTPPNMLQDGSFTTLTIGGEDKTTDENFVKINAKATMAIPCEVPGFTFDEALDMAPPVIDDERTTGCPTRQEIIPALAAGGPEVTATAMVGEMFLTPNDELCSAGGLVSPLQFGSDRPGATRSELMFELGPIEDATVWGDDSALFDALTPWRPVDRTCETDDQGRPLPVEGSDSCELRQFHQLEEGWLSIIYDNQLADGPDTIIRASVPWGTFRYVCHHCRPDDPEIERFLGQFNDFATDWTDTLQQSIDDAAAADAELAAQLAEEAATEAEQLAAEAEAEAEAEDASVEAEQVAAESDAESTEAPSELEQDAGALGIDPELVDLFVDEDDDDTTRDAALAALVGLLGAAGVMGTAVVETGLSASELATRFREGGIGGLNDAIEEHEEHLSAVGVVDEYGDLLLPDDDGLYTWDDGDSSRQVERAELEALIAQAQAAAVRTEAEHAALMADHERFRDQSWDELRARVRLETAEEMAEIAIEQLEAERLRRRGDRLHDVLAEMDHSPLRESMLDFLDRNPSPSDDDFWRLREIMRQQEADQRVIDALGDQSELSMALEGIQEDVAWLAEMAGQPGMAMMIRNPEIPVRLGVAYATGGLSEVALAPIDVWNTLDDKADAMLEAENRDLTTAEITIEIAQAVVIEYLGARLGGGSGVEPPPRRPMQLLPENYIDAVRPGQKIPLLHQTGYTPQHLRQLTTFAERRGVVPGTRMANQYSAAHIRAGKAIPKPLNVKPKSISELDVHLGARPDHLGTVGFFKPKVPDTSGMGDDLARDVMDRYRSRASEWSKYHDEIAADPNLIMRDGRIFDAKTGKAFAGDMDLVYLKDAKTGEVITGSRYRELRDEMIREGIIEHGAEFNIHADLTEGLVPGTREYDEAMKQADKIAQNVLMPTHMDGAPILEIVDGNAVRGEDVFMLPVNPD